MSQSPSALPAVQRASWRRVPRGALRRRPVAAGARKSRGGTGSLGATFQRNGLALVSAFESDHRYLKEPVTPRAQKNGGEAGEHSQAPSARGPHPSAERPRAGTREGGAASASRLPARPAPCTPPGLRAPASRALPAGSSAMSTRRRRQPRGRPREWLGRGLHGRRGGAAHGARGGARRPAQSEAAPAPLPGRDFRRSPRLRTPDPVPSRETGAEGLARGKPRGRAWPPGARGREAGSRDDSIQSQASPSIPAFDPKKPACPFVCASLTFVHSEVSCVVPARFWPRF